MAAKEPRPSARSRKSQHEQSNSRQPVVKPGKDIGSWIGGTGTELQMAIDEVQRRAAPRKQKTSTNTVLNYTPSSSDEEVAQASSSKDFKSPRTPVTALKRRDTENSTSNEPESYFNPHGLSRPASIYSLSRVSLSSQISQLTSIQLPQASSLSNSISSISSSLGASRALKEAADQIQRWTTKASEVLSGLDADDDAEWAAAAGREGVGEVDGAIKRFEKLIQVYVGSVEDMHHRSDVTLVPKEDMRHLVDQIEKITKDWRQVKNALQNVKNQVELAMEWEELWNTVLGDIGLEIESLSSLVFEMEERRHRSGLVENSNETDGIDISEFENVVDSPSTQMETSTFSHRFSLPPVFASNSSMVSPGPSFMHEESNLLGLFARMQPLRASLDFLPMRLATFHNRSSSMFPTACDELQERRSTLEQQWKRLETDAESLRKELGEDRWILVFQNAGKQALKMIDSVARSVTKLDESLDSNTQLSHAPSTGKKIDNFEAKKLHYGPAIERVISIVEQGVKDRLTVNGEIIRLQTDLRQKWQTLKADVRNMDLILEQFNSQEGQQLRDSISTIVSEHSFASSTIDTPGSSPASSVYHPSRQSSDELSQPYSNGRPGQLATPNSEAKRSAERRYFSVPVSNITSAAAGHSTTSRYSGPPPARSASQSTINSRPAPSSALPNRPRWNGSTVVSDVDVTQGWKALASLNTSSSHRKTPILKHRASMQSLTSHTTSHTATPGQRPSSKLSNSSPSMSPMTPSSTKSSRSASKFNLGPGPYAQTPPSARHASALSTRPPPRSASTFSSPRAPQTARSSGSGQSSRHPSSLIRSIEAYDDDFSQPPSSPLMAPDSASNRPPSSVSAASTTRLSDRASLLPKPMGALSRMTSPVPHEGGRTRIGG